jgi:hypothetical protein
VSSQSGLYWKNKKNKRKRIRDIVQMIVKTFVATMLANANSRATLTMPEIWVTDFRTGFPLVSAPNISLMANSTISVATATIPAAVRWGAAIRVVVVAVVIVVIVVIIFALKKLCKYIGKREYKYQEYFYKPPYPYTSIYILVFIIFKVICYKFKKT